MLSDKPSVAGLVQLLLAHNIKDVVISPGSRNAPLSISFHHHPDIKTWSIVDERSAAFFALGLAQEKGSPVALCCTSGSAGLNYSPALVEALYQRVPLIAITADRPPEWVNQGEGQTMLQTGMLSNVVKASYNMAEPATDKNLQWFNARQVNEAIIEAEHHPKGPVHINFPFRESLYGKVNEAESKAKVIQRHAPIKSLGLAEEQRLAKHLSSCKKILVLTGLGSPDPKLTAALERFAQLPQVNVLTENTSNLHSPHFLGATDRLLLGMKKGEDELFLPDLLITIGSAIISKKIKGLLRKHPANEHWHIDRTGQLMDTFQQLTQIIEMVPSDFFAHMAEQSAASESNYHSYWTAKNQQGEELAEEFGAKAPISDLKAVFYTLRHIPENSIVHMANSACVRYAQLFSQRADLCFRANRGVSGIDGCTSTSVGAHQATHKPLTLITGDTAFFYDSNGLWNQYLKDNYKIVLVNNGGGGIFRIIDGPDKSGVLEEHFEAHHQNTAEALCQMHKLKYIIANSSETLQDGLVRLYNDEQPALLEIFTPRLENAKQLWAFFDYVKQGLK